MDVLEIANRFAMFFIPLLFSLCVHEYAHGWVAKLRGDRTAEMMGRLTLNPVPHMDPIGTVLLPALSVIFQSPIFFGWAKPVPVDPRNLKTPRTDMFWVALAGPLSNVLLALIGSLLLVVAVLFFRDASFYEGMRVVGQQFILTNLFLAVFNMIPLHPLDGGKVLARFLPYSINRKLEENEHISGMILLALLLMGVLSILAIPVHFLYRLFLGLASGIFGL